MIQATTWLTMPALLGPISGPPLGGLLTDAFGWRSIFLINVPIGVIGLVLVAWKIPATPPGDPGPPDRIGLGLIGLALALLMFGLETVGRGMVPPGVAPGALLLGGVVGWAAVRHCRRVARPAVDFTLLRIPAFHHATIAGSLFRIGAGTSPFLVPLLLQVGFGHSASEAGLVTFATALGALAMKPLVRPVLRRFGFRTAIMAGSLLAGASIAVGAAFTAAWPLALIFLVLAIGGLFRSLQFTALNTLAFAEVPQARLSAATSFFGTVQQLSPALGVVLASATLEASAALAGRHGDAPLMAGDFAAGFLVGGAVVAFSAIFFARMPRDVGAAVSGHGGKADAERG
jgi:MFS family permease